MESTQSIHPSPQVIPWVAEAVGPGATIQAIQHLAGASFVYHPYWDVSVAIEVLPGPPRVYSPWVDFGVRHVNDNLMRERIDAYLVRVMACL